MDQNSLVSDGTELVKLLDQSKVKPRAAMWVYNSETDTWRLWIVPAKDVSDKSEFYRILSEVISKHRDDFPSFDISSVEYKTDDHPVMSGLGRMLHMEGLGSAHLSNNKFNGFFLPDGIVLRMAI